MRIYENLDNIRLRKHILEVNLQLGEYKGRLLSKPIVGNCFGLSIIECIDSDLIYEIEDYNFINCDIKLLGEDDDGNWYYSYKLFDDKGNMCEGEDECSYFSNLIVGINIVRCEIAK